MATPETTAKTEGPILGTSSIIAANDSLLNNNLFLSAEPSIRKLSHYISSDPQRLFIERNKTALQDYEKFLKITKNKNTKSKNNKNNFLEHYYKYPYKDNPKLIIGSYNTQILGNNDISVNKKYKVDIIGVDEGLIQLPISLNNEFSKILNVQENINLDNKKDTKDQLTIPNIKNNKKKTISKLKLKNNINNFEMYSTNDIFKKKIKLKKKKKNLSLFDRGEEYISKIGLPKDENGNLNDKKSNFEKMREDFENQNTYKYEIKKLENWDFEHFQKDALKRYISKENISNILKKTDNSQMKWYIDIKNDKKQLKLMSRNKYLKEFFMRIEEEQKAIYLQSISINKKGFNFDIFNNDEKEKDKEIEIDEKKDKSQIKYIQFYKEVMKEKLKIEEMFHSELANCAQDVHLTRIKKKEALVKLYEIMQAKKELYKEEQNVKKLFHRNMERMNEYTDVLNILVKLASDKKKINNNDNNGSIKSPKREKKKSPKKYKFNKISEKLLNTIKFETISNENKIKALKRNSIFVQNANNFLLNEKPKQKFNLEKLDLTAFHEKADLFQLQSDLIAQKNEIETEYNKKMSKIAEMKNDLDFKFKNKKSDIQNLNAYFKKTKSNLNLRIQTLSGYYYQILKKGIDVRKNGLSWVIVKLMELNVYIDKHYLPTFLDEEQMGYILRMGVKIHELSELIKLFQILKERQKILRDKHLEEEMKKEKDIDNNNFVNLIKNNHRKMGNNYMKFIEDIQMKYENVIKICLNENKEEEKINRIKEDLKEQILKSKDDEMELLNEPELYFIPGSLAEFFEKDKRFRIYFDDIFYLNEEINKRRKNILEEKENELKIFRNKYDLDDNLNRRNNKVINNKTISIKNEQIYAALFGNGISL